LKPWQITRHGFCMIIWNAWVVQWHQCCSTVTTYEHDCIAWRATSRFEANIQKYNYGYYLANSIYPRWQTFVKPVVKPNGKNQTQFRNA
jgi:hypothetical protein